MKSKSTTPNKKICRECKHDGDYDHCSVYIADGLGKGKHLCSFWKDEEVEEDEEDEENREDDEK